MCIWNHICQTILIPGIFEECHGVIVSDCCSNDDAFAAVSDNKSIDGAPDTGLDKLMNMFSEYVK